MAPDKIAEIIKRCIATGRLPSGSRGCLLCGDNYPDEPMLVGVWLAGKELQRRLGCSKERLADGGARVIVYVVCPTCFDRPTMAEEVEDVILQKGGVQ